MISLEFMMKWKVMKMVNKPVIVELNMEVLQAVAKYYEFPVAVFFLPKSEWEKKKEVTRLSELLEKADKLDNIRDMFGSDD